MSASKIKRGEVLEASVESYLVAEVERCGGMCLKLVDAGRKGFPDRTVIWPAYSFARVHFIELKTVGGRLESWQKRYLEDLRRHECRVFVLWTCKMVDEYIKRFADLPF
jgi:hypothetical protein